MDITPLFRACVKTIRTRNKALGVTNPDNNAGVDKSVSRLLPSTRRTEFGTRAREVVRNISRLKDFLLEHRRAYLNTVAHLSDVPHMSDYERDQIDVGAQKIMKTCHQLIHDLRQVAKASQANMQSQEHQQAAMELVESYLKAACEVYSQQRAIRVKRSVEQQKMTRLESTDGMRAGTAATARKMSATTRATAAAEEEEEGEPLSPEELQMLEMENQHLFGELNSLAEEVRRVEGKVVKIAQLQEVFTEKVLQQEKEIEKVSTVVMGTNMNIRLGNEQVRQAIQHNAGFRLWILFFLAVMSFSLLFLDWYND